MNKFAGSLLLLSSLLCYGDEEVWLGVAGGITNTTDAYLTYISSSGSTYVSLPGLTPPSLIWSVDLNTTNMNALAGGFITDGMMDKNAYLVTAVPSGTATEISLPGLTHPSEVLSVGLNTNNRGVAGGYITNGMGDTVAYVSTIAADGTPTQISLPSLINPSKINSVAINNNNQSIVGGIIDGDAVNNKGYVAKIDANGTPTTVTLPTITSPAEILRVAINDAGQAIVGGYENNMMGDATPYAAVIPPAGSPIKVTLPVTGGAMIQLDDEIRGVAINGSGTSILAGSVNNLPLLISVAPDGTATPLPTITLNNSIAYFASAAINSRGDVVAGGARFFGMSQVAPYITVCYFDQAVPTLVGYVPDTPNGLILDVAINDFGQVWAAGQTVDSMSQLSSVIYLLTKEGTITEIGLPNTSVNGAIASIKTMLLNSTVPTEGLSGNNLAFANYINNDSPLQAFYFIPAVIDGTLAQALESAAPTRNALSLYVADQTVFSLDTALSNHSVLGRWARKRRGVAKPTSIAALALEGLTAGLKQQPPPPQSVEEPPYEFWMTTLGALGEQKRQHQTPAFTPITGAVIVAFDGKVSNRTRLGVGGAYAYTHLHEKEGAGHAIIQQEYLVGYAQWETDSVYLNGALWGGSFQISNLRKIHMTGFSFESKSHPHGWQLAPHFEVGSNYAFSNNRWAIEPFIMADWVANWQKEYQEKGNGPFNAGIKGSFSSMLRSEAGVRFYQNIYFQQWKMAVEEKLSYVNKKPFEVGTLNAFLIGAPGSFTVETLTTPQNLGVGSLHLLFQHPNHAIPRIDLAYQGEFGAMSQQHIASLELNWRF